MHKFFFNIFLDFPSSPPMAGFSTFPLPSETVSQLCLEIFAQLGGYKNPNYYEQEFKRIT
jgi:hypothetical protein